jgi:hypothetical protein
MGFLTLTFEVNYQEGAYQMRPLSTPFNPVLWPQSAILIPGHHRPSASRIWQTKA